MMVAADDGYWWHTLQKAHVANGTRCKRHTLQMAHVANGTRCKWHTLQMAAEDGAPRWHLWLGMPMMQVAANDAGRKGCLW